jgi:hypothetical protein
MSAVHAGRVGKGPTVLAVVVRALYPKSFRCQENTNAKRPSRHLTRGRKIQNLCWDSWHVTAATVLAQVTAGWMDCFAPSVALSGGCSSRQAKVNFRRESCLLIHPLYIFHKQTNNHANRFTKSQKGIARGTYRVWNTLEGDVSAGRKDRRTNGMTWNQTEWNGMEYNQIK